MYSREKSVYRDFLPKIAEIISDLPPGLASDEEPAVSRR
jgi:hypothetical protein